MSDSKKVVVAVDVDEVLASFLVRLIEFHNQTYNSQLKITDFHSYHFCDVWGGSNDEAVVKVNQFFESHYFKELPRIPGSFETLSELHQTGLYEFHIVTSRQTILEPITCAWLDSHFPGLFTSILHGNAYGSGAKREKGDMCKELGAVALIDDNWKYIEQCTSNGIHGILFNLNNEYNWSKPHSLPENCTLATSWNDIKAALLKLAEQ